MFKFLNKMLVTTVFCNLHNGGKLCEKKKDTGVPEARDSMPIWGGKDFVRCTSRFLEDIRVKLIAIFSPFYHSSIFRLSLDKMGFYGNWGTRLISWVQRFRHRKSSFPKICIPRVKTSLDGLPVFFNTSWRLIKKKWNEASLGCTLAYVNRFFLL